LNKICELRKLINNQCGSAEEIQAMPTRTNSQTVTFAHPFLLKGVDRMLPAGDYKVATDEELIQELSFPVYRRVATMIFVPAECCQASSVEMVAIDPRDLQEARDRDAATQPNPAASARSQSELTREKD
jgi:hypothetical protein